MGWEFWKLLPEGLAIEHIAIDADGVTIGASCIGRDAKCPVCGQPSSRIHRYCERTLADLPWSGRCVRLVVRARHLRCRNPDCPRKVFSERLDGTAAVCARRTERLTDMLLGIAYELGGEAGARAAACSGIDVSGDTLLNILRAATLPERSTPSVLGVDDWSYKRGVRFGTMLVDLEHHLPVDLLPDRSSESFSHWLQEHPGVEVIARDRSDIYAQGARRGAPEALQVADRWHLLRNLGDAVGHFLMRHHKQLEAATKALAAEASDVQASSAARSTPIAVPTPARQPTKAEDRKRQTRERRKARYDRVVALAGRGLSRRAIAGEVGLSRATVRSFLAAGSFPEYAGGATKHLPNMLEAYEADLRRRWDEGCRSAAQLHRELQRDGFEGSAVTVRRYVHKWRAEGSRRGRSCRSFGRKQAPASIPSYTPRRASWLFLKDSDELRPKEQAYLERFCQLCPAARTLERLSHEFGRVVRQRDREGLRVWLREAEGSPIAELVGFAEGIRRDLSEVEAALSTEWSSGQVEGQTTRLKMLKRQMYGRAGFELLRRRVLRIRPSEPTTPVFGTPLPAIVAY